MHVFACIVVLGGARVQRRPVYTTLSIVFREKKKKKIVFRVVPRFDSEHKNVRGRGNSWSGWSIYYGLLGRSDSSGPYVPPT